MAVEYFSGLSNANYSFVASPVLLLTVHCTVTVPVIYEERISVA